MANFTTLNRELAEYTTQEKSLVEEQHMLTKERRQLSSATAGHIKEALVLENLKTAIQTHTEAFFTKAQEWRAIHQKKLSQTHTTSNRKQQEDRIKELKPRIEHHRTASHQLAKQQKELNARAEQLTTIYNSTFQAYTKELHIKETTIKALESQQTLMQETANTHQKELHELERAINENQTKMTGLCGVEKKRADVEQQFERRKTYYHTFVAQGNAFQKEVQALTQKQNLVCKDDAACPLCKQALSTQRRTSITKSLTQESSFVSHRLKRLSRLIAQLKGLLITQHKHLDTLTKQQKTIHQLEQEHTHLVAKRTKAQERHESVTQSLTKLQRDIEREANAHAVLTKQKPVELTDYVQADTTYKALQESVQKHEQSVASLAHYEQEYHNTIHAISSTAERRSQLADQLALQHERTKEIHALNQEIKKWQKEADAIAGAVERQSAHTQKITSIESKQTELAELVHATHQKKEHYIKQKGALESHIKLIEQKEQTKKEMTKQRKQIAEHKEDFASIAQAFGRDGIQALLIEEAIPEIESDANELLARLTDNQAHIMIESLRDLKSGSTRETLDIKISDPLGIRPYELFSGGEAFRIDFALRIAISKLLAKRAGASLQLLIIDEGFGSQDEDGLSHIMDAIYKIQDDFAKVIIVSHLPSMKEQFPVHFIVEKGANGTKVRVVEQG